MMYSLPGGILKGLQKVFFHIKDYGEVIECCSALTEVVSLPISSNFFYEKTVNLTGRATEPSSWPLSHTQS